MSRPPLLFLAHRLPYPPTKGDKLRAYHFLTRLAESFDIHLGTLVDDDADWPHRRALEGVCAAVHVGDIRRRKQLWAGAESVLRREPATYALFREASLMRFVDSFRRRWPGAPTFAFSSGVGPYLTPGLVAGGPGRLVMDFVDVDSAKWESLAEASDGPVRHAYAREARLLAREESKLARMADASVFVSQAEANLFTRRTSLPAHSVPNGVDTAYWAAGADMPSPYEDSRQRIIFTGVMNYPPNVEAAAWFAEKVFPWLRRDHPDVEFVIAGGSPTPQIKALTRQPGVRVTGRVEDMRPWLAHATMAVAPLQIARGVQNKVLEAMAAGVPIAVTPLALEGVEAQDGVHLRVANGPQLFVSTVARLLNDPQERADLSEAARRLMRARYSWDESAAQAVALLQADAPQTDILQTAGALRQSAP